MYEIIFTDSAKRQLSKLDIPIQRRILLALERLRFNPERYISKLVGTESFRLRVGDYRVIVDIKKDKLIVLVIRVGHRRNIYDAI